jgi:undecaprenyl-diphosphatase
LIENTTIIALLLGILEGLTEFIPVSSTGHLLLAGYFLGFESAGKTFEVVIQFGSVLAILTIYASKLWQVFRDAPHDPTARRFILSVLIAFMPSVVVGVLAYDFIKTVLFETPMLIAVMLILGGIVLLIVDRLPMKPQHDDAMRFPLGMALGIGVAQVLAMVPGVSRSGATIVASLLLGADKRSAAEFSFFLSMPTMAGAFTYDIYQNRNVLDAGAVNEIVIGFIAAFVTAVFVVRWLLDYVSKHGYALFGWWRIVVGSVALVALLAS